MSKVFILIVMIMSGMIPEVFVQVDTKAQSKSMASIDVYYFHATRRCYTCNNVENQSKAALEKLYPKEIEAGSIVFHSVNFEETEGEAMMKQLKVSGQALLVVKGDQRDHGNTEIHTHSKLAKFLTYLYVRSNIDVFLRQNSTYASS